MESVPLSECRAMVSESNETRSRVTIDGRPAVIVGWRNPFATVVADDNPEYRADYAWSTARRIFYGRNGHFGT